MKEVLKWRSYDVSEEGGVETKNVFDFYEQKSKKLTRETLAETLGVDNEKRDPDGIIQKFENKIELKIRSLEEETEKNKAIRKTITEWALRWNKLSLEENTYKDDLSWGGDLEFVDTEWFLFYMDDKLIGTAHFNISLSKSTPP